MIICITFMHAVFLAGLLMNLPDPEAVTLSEFNRAAKTNFLFIRESC